MKNELFIKFCLLNWIVFEFSGIPAQVLENNEKIARDVMMH